MKRLGMIVAIASLIVAIAPTAYGQYVPPETKEPVVTRGSGTH